jgi:predicted anti-sigma-YlaC factor YlaD
MNQARLGTAEAWLSIVVIVLAVPRVLWPDVLPGALRAAVIAAYVLSSACGMIAGHLSGALYAPLSRLPQFAALERHHTLHLCATVMAMWVIFFPPD